jgi:hypothetical protein
MSRVWHSRVYGSMNKHQRRKLGLGRYRREDVWRRMAAQEATIMAAATQRQKPWWRRILDWALRLVHRGR